MALFQGRTTSDGSQLTLSDLWRRGPLVVTFYRGDFCPVCNRYLHSLQERAGEFQQARVQIVAVSSDQPDLERQTVERQELAFPVLSDPGRAAVDAYDAIYNEREGHAEPAVFIIGADGTLIYESIVSGPLGRPTPDDVLKIAQMSFARRAAG